MKNCELSNLLLNPLKRIIPLTLFLIISSHPFVQAGTTESGGLLDKKITLVAEKREVKDVLTEISKLVEIKFVYIK